MTEDVLPSGCECSLYADPHRCSLHRARSLCGACRPIQGVPVELQAGAKGWLAHCRVIHGTTGDHRSLLRQDAPEPTPTN